MSNKKEIHVINGTGSMRQCDLYPEKSMHSVSIDENGVRWTKGGRDSIHPDIGSEPHDKIIVGNMCSDCENVFTDSALFVGEDCVRCHERKTIVNRN